MTEDLLVRLGGPPAAAPALIVERVQDAEDLRAYRELRRRVFVVEQGLFARDDADEHDLDSETIVLVARRSDGVVAGGVRLFPRGGDPSLGWWQGSRLVCTPGPDRGAIGAALARAACATAEAEGALRFDATVQPARERFFARLGWERVREVTAAGAPHVLMRCPLGLIAGLLAGTKAPLGGLLAGLAPGGPGWVGDDGVPLGAGDVVAACDAIMPGMVARDPEWAGWCGMLVCANDLAAMGAEPIGALDLLGAPDRALAARVLDGLGAGSEAFGLPILGGHTTLGAPASLGVSAFGRAADPVPGGGGRPGDVLTLTADLGGRWRPGYRGTQWDSTSHRTTAERRRMLDAVAAVRPRAAKDVSMAGVAGCAGMLAEASGCGAELDVAAIPRPAGTRAADWLTCFPGFAMLTADAPGAPGLPAGPAVGAPCGRLVAGAGVTLAWPDGERTVAIAGGVTGLGPAHPA